MTIRFHTVIPMVNAYSFDEKNSFSKKGIVIVSDYLKTMKKTVKVINVEDDPKSQSEDIDIIWVRKNQDIEVQIPIEVKTDNYTTGNFWLETFSNEKAGTPGCFVKSKAKYLFYYFPKWNKMYIIPLKKAQQWFAKNKDRFPESKTTTKDKAGAYTHTTVGKKVPIEVMTREVDGIKVVAGKLGNRSGPTPTSPSSLPSA